MNTQESTRPERLEKSVEIGTLCAFYGGLLTQRQQEMLRLYYEEDFSLGEIAEQFGVSRQNVHELITRSVQKLRRYEAAWAAPAAWRPPCASSPERFRSWRRRGTAICPRKPDKGWTRPPRWCGRSSTGRKGRQKPWPLRD